MIARNLISNKTSKFGINETFRKEKYKKIGNKTSKIGNNTFKLGTAKAYLGTKLISWK